MGGRRTRKSRVGKGNPALRRPLTPADDDSIDGIHPSWAADFDLLTAEVQGPNLTEMIQAHMAERKAREIAAIEAACEQAVTDPRGWGVKIIRYLNGIEVGLSEDVPYGEIHSYEIAGIKDTINA
jgi:hypothetical protein